MTIGPAAARLFCPLSVEILDALADIATADTADFAGRHPRHGDLMGRRIAVALCQGAALHWIDGVTGIKDLDVWSFYAEDARHPRFPPRRMRRAETIMAGTRVRVDVLGRTLLGATEVPTDAADAIIRYLAQGRTASARHLARKAVVMIRPDPGRVIWSAGKAV